VASARFTSAFQRSERLITDDRAPVEFITDSVMVRFALESGAAQFPAQP
jgi:hypothetical protein